MPKHWVSIINSGGNPHERKVFELSQEVYGIVTDGNGGLDELLWKPGSKRWYVVIHATEATDLDGIVAALKEAGYRPQVTEKGLHSPEEKALRDTRAAERKRAAAKKRPRR